jgi:hypothetical protein
MRSPHTPNPKPNWYGESVGRYEGDTLVVDTIGQTARTFVGTDARCGATSKLCLHASLRPVVGISGGLKVCEDEPVLTIVSVAEYRKHENNTPHTGL